MVDADAVSDHRLRICQIRWPSSKILRIRSRSFLSLAKSINQPSSWKMSKKEFIIKDTHRGLLYRNGVMEKVLGAGRHVFRANLLAELLGRTERIEVVVVDMRARELTIKGQEILTSDKVAVRVSILVQFNVTDPQAATHVVESYSDRIYSDVQLAARRSLAQMNLEDILTNRHRLSEEILADVQEAATGYGVRISRADIKDLTFPGNLQEIMNRVLAAERQAQAQLVEARTKAEVQTIDAQARATNQRLESETKAVTIRREAEARADADRLALATELDALARRRESAQAYAEHPALLRLQELEVLQSIATNANARIHFATSVGLANEAPESKGAVERS
jgi:regulator of protease activity HflC (stomatin/prohibitin superfamily)